MSARKALADKEGFLKLTVEISSKNTNLMRKTPSDDTKLACVGICLWSAQIKHKNPKNTIVFFCQMLVLFVKYGYMLSTFGPLSTSWAVYSLDHL